MSQYAVPVVWSPETRRHDPRHEVWVGVADRGHRDAPRGWTRSSTRCAPAATTWWRRRPQPDDALLAVHEPELLEFLRTAADRWAAGPYARPGRPGAGGALPVPHAGDDRRAAGPARGRHPRRRRPVRLRHDDAGRSGHLGGGPRRGRLRRPGRGRWWPDGAPLAYALCRPPGHHATPAGFGGSCYLNNAAVAAAALRASGAQRVGIVDIDAHQGNGTAAIFYDRADVLYGSVHVDPAAGWFPHVVGYADETGAGAGEGATRNLPLPEGTGDEPWLAAVAELAEWVTGAGCDHLVVSLGVDAAADDPESPLQVTADGYREAGRLLGATGLPAVAVQEGGYHLATLGGLVAAYLDGHASA